ncbi:MAG: hypothetical protein Q7S47_02855 [bacterium]|nr:hypothetical protein [bacterium]
MKGAENTMSKRQQLPGEPAPLSLLRKLAEDQQLAWELGGDVGCLGQHEYGLPSISAVHEPEDSLWRNGYAIPIPHELSAFVTAILGDSWEYGDANLFPWHLHRWVLDGHEYYIGKGARRDFNLLGRDQSWSLILFPVEFVDTDN